MVLWYAASPLYLNIVTGSGGEAMRGASESLFVEAAVHPHLVVVVVPVLVATCAACGALWRSGACPCVCHLAPAPGHLPVTPVLESLPKQ